MTDPNLTNEILSTLVSCDSGEADIWQYSKFGIQLFYIVPLGVLYASFLFAIINKKSGREFFKDSFFRLNLVDGFISLFFLSLDISFLRMTSYIRPACEYFLQILQDRGYYLTPYFSLYLYLQMAKMLSTLIMNMNRYTSIALPVTHKIFWRTYCSLFLTLIFTVPLLFIWPVTIAQTRFLPFYGQAVIGYDHIFSWARTTYGRIIIGGITLCFILYFSIIASFKLKKLGKHMRRAELSINIATLFTSAGFVLLLIMQVCYLVLKVDSYVNSKWITKLIIAGTQIGNDFYMLSGPVVLLILDKRIRKSVFLWPRRKPKIGQDIRVSVQLATIT